MESKSLAGIPGRTHTPGNYHQQIPNLLPRPPKLIKVRINAP